VPVLVNVGRQASEEAVVSGQHRRLATLAQAMVHVLHKNAHKVLRVHCMRGCQASCKQWHDWRRSRAARQRQGRQAHGAGRKHGSSGWDDHEQPSG